MLNLSQIAAAPQQGIAEGMAKDIISFCKSQIDGYYRTQTYQNWRAQSEAIVDATEQRWRTGEQVTRSGFYLAALRAEYDGLKEGAVNVLTKANPLFIYRKKPGNPQEVADKIQQHVNDEWDTMDGLEKFLEIADDTWTHGVGISYTKWQTIEGYGQFPVVVPNAFGDMIDWQEGWQAVSSGPELERIHPFNWAGEATKARGLAWEACLREWEVCDLHRLKGDKRYIQPGVEKTLQNMREGKSTQDAHYYHPAGDDRRGNTSKVVAYEYWGTLTGVKGFEDDPHEYVVIWVDEQLIRFNHNPIYIGGERFRPFTRTRSNPFNNFPMGRSILGPNLTHQKLMNLIVNLGTDDLVIRQHLGIAAWADSMENVNDLANPEGARGFVWMKNTANPNMLPRFIGEGQSGIMRDSMDFMDRFILTDMQKSGLNNTSQGLKEGSQNGTATAAQLQASMGNKRIQSALTQVCKTGLRPIAKHITLLTLRNRPMADMPFDNNAQMLALTNNNWGEHDSVTNDPYQEAMNKAEFYNMFKDVAMQLVSANGDASHLIEMGRDIARDKGIKPDDFNRYFPLSRPPEVGKGPMQPGGALPALDTPKAQAPTAPEQQAPPQLPDPMQEPALA